MGHTFSQCDSIDFIADVIGTKLERINEKTFISTKIPFFSYTQLALVPNVKMRDSSNICVRVWCVGFDVSRRTQSHCSVCACAIVIRMMKVEREIATNSENRERKKERKNVKSK